MRCKHCNEPIYKTKSRVWLHKENNWYSCENNTTVYVSMAAPKTTVKEYYEMCKM